MVIYPYTVSKHINSYINSGNDSNLEEFPWAARLGYEKSGNVEYNCGGSIISGKW